MKIILFLFLAHSTITKVYTQNWKLEKDKEGVFVHTRVVPNSKIKEFKAEVTIENSPKEIIEILLNFENYPNWIAGISNCKLLKSSQKKEYTYYLGFSAPWPVAQRDAILNATVHKSDTGEITLIIKNLPDYIPKKNNVKRVPSLNGYWKITPLPNGKTKVIQQVHAEPGGSIPGWLANCKVTDDPYNTFKNLRKALKK